MNKDNNYEKCCQSSSEELGCCHVEGVAQIDKKGQIVLPKSLRVAMELKDKDKLIIIGMREKGKIVSISLIKAHEIDDMIKIKLKPVMKKILEE